MFDVLRRLNTPGSTVHDIPSMSRVILRTLDGGVKSIPRITTLQSNGGRSAIQTKSLPTAGNIENVQVS